MQQPFRFRGRFTKEPRRGVDPNEQRQIQDFIARNGVKKLEPGFAQSGNDWFNHITRGVTFGTGHVSPRAHAG